MKALAREVQRHEPDSPLDAENIDPYPCGDYATPLQWMDQGPRHPAVARARSATDSQYEVVL